MTPDHEADNRHHEGDDEDDLRDASGARGKSEEAKNRRDQSDDEQCESDGDHEGLLRREAALVMPGTHAPLVLCQRQSRRAPSTTMGLPVLSCTGSFV